MLLFLLFSSLNYKASVVFPNGNLEVPEFENIIDYSEDPIVSRLHNYRKFLYSTDSLF